MIVLKQGTKRVHAAALVLGSNISLAEGADGTWTLDSNASTTAATDSRYVRLAGQGASGQQAVDTDFLVNSANGRVWGISGLASGHTVNFQYGGDGFNAIVATFGAVTEFRSYHGLQVFNYTANTQANKVEIARFGTSNTSTASYFRGQLGVGGTSLGIFGAAFHVSGSAELQAGGYLKFASDTSGVSKIGESWGVRLEGNASHPVQAAGPFMVGSAWAPSGGSYTDGRAYVRERVLSGGISFFDGTFSNAPQGQVWGTDTFIGIYTNGGLASQLKAGSLFIDTNFAATTPKFSVDTAGLMNAQNVQSQGYVAAVGVVRSTSVNGWAIGNVAGVARIQYDATAGKKYFTALNEADGYASFVGIIRPVTQLGVGYIANTGAAGSFKSGMAIATSEAESINLWASGNVGTPGQGILLHWFHGNGGQWREGLAIENTTGWANMRLMKAGGQITMFGDMSPNNHTVFNDSGANYGFNWFARYGFTLTQNDGAGNYTDRWLIYQNTGETSFYIRDLTNNRTHVQFARGTSDTSAVTNMYSSLGVAGNLVVGGGSAVTSSSLLARRNEANDYGANLQTAENFKVTGSAAAYTFADRVNNANTFVLYASSDLARLWHSSASDMIWFHRFGHLSVLGGTLAFDNALDSGTTVPNGVRMARGSDSAGVSLSFLNGGTALQLRMGGSLISNSYADAANIPANGLWVKGLAIAADFQMASDRRLKRDITPITGALSRLRAINGVTYLLKADETRRRRAGVLADEVLVVHPEAVSVQADGHFAVSYDAILPLVIEAVKEIAARMDQAGL